MVTDSCLMGLCSFLLPPTFFLPTELTPPVAGFGRDFHSYISLPLGFKNIREWWSWCKKEQMNVWVMGRAAAGLWDAKEIKELLHLSPENSKKCIDYSYGSVKCDLPWGKWSISKNLGNFKKLTKVWSWGLSHIFENKRLTWDMCAIHLPN